MEIYTSELSIKLTHIINSIKDFSRFLVYSDFTKKGHHKCKPKASIFIFIEPNQYSHNKNNNTKLGNITTIAIKTMPEQEKTALLYVNGYYEYLYRYFSTMH